MRATLVIRAAADPQTLPRILGLVAQRWLVPSEFVARLDGDMLDIRCSVSGLSAALVAAKLRESVLVQAVEIVEQAGEAALHR